MADNFAALDAALSGAVNAMFGEAFKIIPYLYPQGDVDGSPVLDTSRQPLDVIAQFVAQAKSTPLPARGSVQDDNAHNATASHPAIHVDNAYLLWPPARGCRVLRLDTGETWEIQRPPRDDGMGHTTIPLTKKMRTA